MSQINAVQEKIDACENDEITQENIAKITNLKSLKNELEKSVGNLKKKSNILWPFSTSKGPHRSRNSTLDIIERIENGEDLTIDEAKGIMGRSSLLSIPDFNFVYDAPGEYMHCGCLGVVKKLVELTFSVGQNRPRLTKRKLSSPVTFNNLMKYVKVPGEFPRRSRQLDFAVFKALEYRNLAIFFFPIVIDCIEKNERERTLWLYIAYMLRSAVIPTEEFVNLSLPEIEKICDDFYQLYETLFGTMNCTYNTHLLCSHLLEIRTHGPLTETSAFKFESFYGELRRAFVSGTTSPTKQIMQNILLKRALNHHNCKNTITVTNYDTALESNRLIYVYEQKKYSIFEISDIEGQTMNCHRVGQYQAVFDETPQINWSKVGVFRRGATSDETTRIKMSKISGKVINVGEYVITCPENVLNEK